MTMKKVAILGSSGQIGAYLTEHLREKGYFVREFDIANDTHEDMTHIPVSYTHLTLPTIYSV